MKAEARLVLQSQGVAHAEQAMNRVRAETIRTVEKEKLSSSYADYYTNLTDSTLIGRFRELYRIELEMFGYPLSPFDTLVDP